MREVVAICDHLQLLFGIDLEQKVGRKAGVASAGLKNFLTTRDTRQHKGVDLNIEHRTPNIEHRREDGIEGGKAEFSEALGSSSSSLPIRVNPVHLRLKIQIRVWGL
jgi:hypothetical protein